MKRRLLVILAMAGPCIPSYADELSLFNVGLRDATPASLHEAALAVGARLIKSSGGHRVYDASRIGLPGAQRLETLFDGERFVIAAYSFKRDAKTDHDLRRLLVTRYGDAHILLSGGKPYEVKLAERYLDRGTYRWSMDAPMELVYTNLAVNPHRSMVLDTETRLTYVNRPLFEELQRRMADSLQQADRERAARLRGMF